MRFFKTYNCVIVSAILSIMIIATIITVILGASAENFNLSSIIAIHQAQTGMLLLEFLMFLLMVTIIYSSVKNQKEKLFLRTFGSLLEESSTNIIGINATGAIYYANKPAIETLGMKTANEVLGENINDLIVQFSQTNSPKFEADLFTQLQKQGQLSGDGLIRLNRNEILEIDFRAREISGATERNRFFAFTFAGNQDRKKLERARIQENHLQSQTIELSNAFLGDESFDAIAQKMLSTFISITGSEYGFVAEVLTDTSSGEEYLQVGALTNIAWNQATRDLYKPSGMIFRGLNTLWGKVLTTRESVIANNPATDPRAKGLPKGHPPMHSFLGIPFKAGGKVVGMVGLANNPEGYSEKDINFLAPILNACAQIIIAKRNKNEIRFLNNRYRDLLDEAPIMYLYVSNLEGGRKILECNNKFLELLGMEKSQLLGKDFLDFLPLHSKEVVLGFHNSETEHAFKPLSTRLDLVDKSGNSRTTQATVVAEFDENGKCGQFKYMLVDMTNFIGIQEENQQLSLEFQRVIDGINSVVIVTDAMGRITHWNKKISALTGLDIFDVAGKKFDELDLPITNKEMINEIIGKSLNRQNFQAISIDLTDMDGEKQNIYLNITCRNSVKGEPLGLIIMGQILTNYLTTITEHYSLQKIEAIGQLTGGVAHDFNNLLTIILGNLEYLEEELPDMTEDMRLAITDATSAARDGAGLTKNLLAFARRRPLHIEKFNLNESLTNVTRLGSRTLGERIKLITSLNTDFELNLDRSMFESSVLNLIINARDAMNDEGTININSESVYYNNRNQSVNPHHMPDGYYGVIRITDTGTGMSEEVKQHAIEPFFTTKKGGKGTGLGLSMVYGFIKQSNGELKIDSQIGRGTTISIYLPLEGQMLDFEHQLPDYSQNQPSA